MKAEEVKKMKDEELAIEPARIRREIFELRSQAVTEKLENPHQIRQKRRDLARLLTESSARKAAKAQETVRP